MVKFSFTGFSKEEKNQEEKNQKGKNQKGKNLHRHKENIYSFCQ